MSCAACQARVEKAVSKVPGVTECSVSLLTNTMGVEGTASEADIIKAVTDAGYGAKPQNQTSASRDNTSRLAAEEEALKDTETPLLKKRLISSIGFFIILMYFSMGHMMFGWPLPHWFDGNHVAMSCSAYSFCHHNGHQRKVFRKRNKRTSSSSAEYGHTCCIRLRCFIYIQHFCIIHDD